MASTIKLKNSTTAGNTPSSLETGEVAINVADGNLFYGSASAVLQNFVVDELEVKGNLTAQQYIVSSSVTYTTQSFSSGSTIFGDTTDDTHQFTGSVDVTGSITTYGDLVLADNSKLQSQNQSTTYIKLVNDDYWQVYANGLEVARFASNQVVINDLGQSAVDFRVEGDTDANLLFTDASADKVGIGTSSPPEKLTVEGNISASGDIIANNLSGTNTGDQDLSSYIQNSQTSSMSVATASYVAVGNIDGTVGTVTEVTVGNGLDITDGTTTPNITLDLTEVGFAGGVSNKLITNDGDGTVTAESNLGFDGTTLDINGKVDIDYSTDNTNTAVVEINNNTTAVMSTDHFALKVAGGQANGAPSGQQKSYGGYFTAGNTNGAFPDSIALYAQGHEDGAPNSYAAIFSGSAGGIVGINTMEPTVELDVVGDVKVSSNITASGDISSSGALIGNTLTASGLNYPSSDGTDGQVIMTDGSGILTFNDVSVYAQVKNVTGGTLAKGTPVHASGSTGNTSEVIAASASVASTMPATFILAEELADEAEGRAIVVGYINGVNTSPFNEGDVVYVGADGGYTNVKPTGSNLIQNLGIVTKIDASNGSGFIYGAGRSNDVPNISPGYAWVGNSDSVATAVATSSFVVDNANTASYVAASNIDGTVTNASTASYIAGGNVDGDVASATDATNATNVNVGNGDGSSTYYILGALGTGNQALKRDNAITFNASSDTLNVGNLDSAGKIYIGANDIELRGDANNLLVYNGGLQAEGAITASGGISASGDITCDNLIVATSITSVGDDITVGDDLVLSSAIAKISFTGTNGGGNEGIQYSDNGGSNRYAMLFPGSDVVAITNRASDGTVEIRANTSTAGSSGEVTVAEFQDDLINLNVAQRRLLEVSTTTDGNGNGDYIKLGSTATTAGKIYYYNSSGNWVLTDANAASSSTGLIAVAMANNSSKGMLLKGMVTLDHDPGTVGDVLYLQTGSGIATSTTPSGTGDVVRVIGYCLDSTNGQIYFDPSKDHIIHA